MTVIMIIVTVIKRTLGNNIGNYLGFYNREVQGSRWVVGLRVRMQGCKYRGPHNYPY